MFLSLKADGIEIFFSPPSSLLKELFIYIY